MPINVTLVPSCERVTIFEALIVSILMYVYLYWCMFFWGKTKDLDNGLDACHTEVILFGHLL